MSRFKVATVRTTSALLAGLAVLLASGCSTVTGGSSATLATAAPVDDRSCESNRDYGMTGVVHASTKRDLDDCRRNNPAPAAAPR